MKLEDLQPHSRVAGIRPEGPVTVVSTKWLGSQAVEVTCRTPSGDVATEVVYRSDEPDLELTGEGIPWTFDADGRLFRLVSEAHRIRLAHLFDPLLAVHTSLVEPLPHQITAVYESMLPRQPLRFLLADDPGSGKTIMAGLLMKELIARGDLQRCLVVCPGSLAEQWQDELESRFQLPFTVYASDKLQEAQSGNWFQENDLVIARLDMLSRNEEVQELLRASDCGWDLVVCDEAHKMSASYFGKKLKYTKRYRLGQLLGRVTRHFLLMTATPHNGKEDDFQLFMALLDGDRFEGRFRVGVHRSDTSDLMRRMVKEKLLKFDGTPLFPVRRAYTVPYKLSQAEVSLYDAVTLYVRQEFNRAERLGGKKRTTVGFALTLLQRRLASSPEAIYRSLRRRRERLANRLTELEELLRHASAQTTPLFAGPELDLEDLEDLEDAPEDEAEELEAEVLDQATAAQSSTELRAEIGTLKELERLARQVLSRSDDTKWRELAGLLSKIFTPTALASRVKEFDAPYGAGEIPPPRPSPGQKLVIFTEHKDTLNYLLDRITTLIGRTEAVVVIHGGLNRRDRLKAQEAFRHDPEVRVLLATDAAGEGINLQRAHLMVNYDLPWNPNRLEQRFGRIHRIGRTEVCHLWNLVAADTREGDVYRTLLDKLETERRALGGQVFDVLGQVQFEGQPLRNLLVKAIRFGERPDIRAHLTTVVDQALDRDRLRGLMYDHALVQDSMDTSRLHSVREEMERALARRLQPHFIESFFLEAFRNLGGSAREREPRRYQVSMVPAAVRSRAREIGTREPVHSRYERIVFEKSLVAPRGQPSAAFVCPGHPLLDAVLDLTLERNRSLLKRGAVLVDDSDHGLEPRVLLYLENAIQDARPASEGEGRTISRQMIYLDLGSDGVRGHVRYALYLDFRPLAEDEPQPGEILARPECAWINGDIESRAEAYAVEHVVPQHLTEIREARKAAIDRTEAAVKDRLTKEISHWDHLAEQLKLQEAAGRPDARLNSSEASKRADQLLERLSARLQELQSERRISAGPPVAMGGMLVVPKGLLDRIAGLKAKEAATVTDTQAIAARDRAIVMEVERGLGFVPADREFDKLGYDIESRVPETGRLRFIEVKGRVEGAPSISVTHNEILFSLNKPDDYVLAIVEFLESGGHQVHYLRRPFQREPDFDVTKVDYSFAALLARAGEPS
ncbi:MAG: helicase-related protein [Gemmatimonadota bacterium]|nr:helicase-related protein [Gemmatimonadota bacterium]